MNVFVVEDSAAVRRLMVRRLASLDAIDVVGEAGSEVDALAMIDAVEPDVVLLDLSLASGGSGVFVLRELRRTGYLGKILMVSTQEAFGEACMQAGADGFYDKASGLETLFDDLSCLAQLKPRTNARATSLEHHRMVC